MLLKPLCEVGLITLGALQNFLPELETFGDSFEVFHQFVDWWLEILQVIELLIGDIKLSLHVLTVLVYLFRSSDQSLMELDITFLVKFPDFGLLILRTSHFGNIKVYFLLLLLSGYTFLRFALFFLDFFLHFCCQLILF